MVSMVRAARRFLVSRKRLRFRKFIFIGIQIVLSFSIGFYVSKFSEEWTGHSDHVGNSHTENDKLPTKSVVGTLNIHVWRGLCGSRLSNLRQSLFFPRYPDERLMRFINWFQIQDNTVEYGQQIFGFVRPPGSGLYRFAIASDDESELWLSPSEDPNKKQLIARVFEQGTNAWTTMNESNKYPDQISEQLRLLEGSRYYIEVVHKQGVGSGFVQVYWKSFKDADFKLISSDYLSSHSDNVLVTARKVVLHSVFSGRYRSDVELKSKTTSRQYFHFYSLPLVPKDNYLPLCDYKTSFVINGTVKGNKGRRMVHKSMSSVFPADDTSMGDADRRPESTSPNQAADRSSIQAVVDKLILSLRLKTSK